MTRAERETRACHDRSCHDQGTRVILDADGFAPAWVVNANRDDAEANMSAEILRRLEIHVFDYA